MNVLLDTSVLFAYLDQDDEHHFRAKEFLLAVAEGGLGVPVVTDMVVAELHNLVRACRLPSSFEAAATELTIGNVAAAIGIRCQEVGSGRLEKVAKVFHKYRDARLSFVDASLLVVQEEAGIDLLATFDRRLGAIAARTFGT